jgi:hypothetical protein
MSATATATTATAHGGRFQRCTVQSSGTVAMPPINGSARMATKVGHSRRHLGRWHRGRFAAVASLGALFVSWFSTIEIAAPRGNTVLGTAGASGGGRLALVYARGGKMVLCLAIRDEDHVVAAAGRRESRPRRSGWRIARDASQADAIVSATSAP